MQMLASATPHQNRGADGVDITDLNKNVTSTSGFGNVAAAGRLTPFGDIGVGCGINWQAGVSYGGGLTAGSSDFGLGGGFNITPEVITVGAGIGLNSAGNASASIQFSGAKNGSIELVFESSSPIHWPSYFDYGVQPVPLSSGSSPFISTFVSANPKLKNSPNRKRRYGLETLYDGTHSINGPEDQAVDIVAIYGLNGNSYLSWTHEKTSVLWLKDLLPSDLPRARIFTYGYPAELSFSKSVSDIVDFSRGLLAALHSGLTQSSEAGPRRLIIFVCHSLGGLQDNHYEDILTSTTSVVFFGTPHRGSATADRGRAIGEAANAFFLVPAACNDLIKSLSLESEKLAVLFESFCKQLDYLKKLDYLKIVTFYERNILASFGRLAGAPITCMIQAKAFAEYVPLWVKGSRIPHSASTTRDAFRKVTQLGSRSLTNWLKYYWFEMDLEYSLPDYFDTIMVSAFFNCAVLLDDCLRMPPAQISNDCALFWAARIGSAKSAEVLLKHGADVNPRLVHQHSPLTIAAQHGHLEVVRILLLDTRIDVDAEGPSGRSALSYAAGNSHLQTFETLFSRDGCRPGQQDHNNWMALFWSMERDHTVVGRALLAHQAVDINHVDRQGRSILSWAAGERLLQALEMLLKQPDIDVNLQDTKGRSPLQWAANNGQGEVIDVLVRDAYNVDKQSKDKGGRSAFSLVCGGCHTDCVRALIKYRCGDVNEEDVSDCTPLAWALDRRSPSTVEALLAGRELKLNHQDQDKRTALIWAANYGYFEVMEMLLQQGADPHIADADGRTALDHAEMYGRVEMSSLLKQAMLVEK
ncbi:hypothetical protein G6011_08427 [Alternaria panax]|uniref:Uncharacterized protein n=1 Tax=Alternaria panax TaxID=48097 RepID=A0AAD4FMI1_9PLEO|nr:hypothetical protein G6011_08427 [Alternaria panax]